jgi:hypothetical protein
MSELISKLMSTLNVQEGQAKGGAGLLFKLAQEKLGGDFSKVAAVLPEASSLIAAAPKAGGAAQLVGGLLGAVGGGKAQGLAGLADLAGGFSQLKLDSGMVAKFIPIVLEFVKAKGGQEIMGLLARALQK